MTQQDDLADMAYRGSADPDESLLIKANLSLLDALHYLQDSAERATVQGAILFALDELESLAEEIGIKGFQHPDGSEATGTLPFTP